MGLTFRYQLDKGCKLWSGGCLGCPIDKNLCPLTDKRAKIRKDIEAGMDKKDIAVKYGVSLRTVQRVK